VKNAGGQKGAADERNFSCPKKTSGNLILALTKRDKEGIRLHENAILFQFFCFPLGRVAIESFSIVGGRVRPYLDTAG
jgi:hypothetical protein